jgi:hypothetical protein
VEIEDLLRLCLLEVGANRIVTESRAIRVRTVVVRWVQMESNALIGSCVDVIF